MTMEQHFVTFFSPGTFVAETSTQPIEAWDPEIAIRRSRDIVERHGARPYAFQFTTRRRNDDELDSKEVARSVTYYLGGKVETLAEVEARNLPSERILRENMKGNGWDRIITSTNGYRWTQPLNPDDVVVTP